MSAASENSGSGNLPELFNAIGSNPGEDDSSEDKDSEDDSEPEEPEIYDFTEETGFSAGDLRPAYDVLEGSYWVDEENENVVVADSSWKQVEEILEEDASEETDETDESGSSWYDRVSSYLMDHDRKYMGGGLLGMGSGLVSGAMGYGLAADVLLTGGAGAFGWGLGGMIGEYFFGDEGEGEDVSSKESDSEFAEYSDWDVEVLDMQEYGEAVNEYRQESG